MLENKTIGFIGAGQMGQAIFRGLIASGGVPADHIVITDVDEKKLGALGQELGVQTVLSDLQCSGAAELAGRVDILVFAVSPQLSRGVLQAAATHLRAEQLVISIMGGISLSCLEAALPVSPVLRVMPNTPLMVRKGVTGIVAGTRATAEHAALGKALFELLGAAYFLTESLLDPFTGLCGCSPAFTYMYIESLAMGAVERGLPAEEAIRMAAQALAGAAEMVLQTGKRPAELMANVCTPGGSTIAGVHTLEANAFRGVVMDALCESCDRMEHVGKKSE